MSRLVLYSKDGCPFCALLKAELTKRGHQFEIVDLSDDEERGRFYAATNTATVPQLFRLDTDDIVSSSSAHHYGGYSDVSKDWNMLKRS